MDTDECFAGGDTELGGLTPVLCWNGEASLTLPSTIFITKIKMAAATFTL